MHTIRFQWATLVLHFFAPIWLDSISFTFKCDSRVFKEAYLCSPAKAKSFMALYHRRAVFKYCDLVRIVRVISHPLSTMKNVLDCHKRNCNKTYLPCKSIVEGSWRTQKIKTLSFNRKQSTITMISEHVIHLP